MQHTQLHCFYTFESVEILKVIKLAYEIMVELVLRKEKTAASKKHFPNWLSVVSNNIKRHLASQTNNIISIYFDWFRNG
jgi:hypothetical protein